MITLKIDVDGCVFFGIGTSRCWIKAGDSGWTSVRTHWSDGESTLESYYPQGSLCYLTANGTWKQITSADEWEAMAEVLPCIS